MKKIAMIEAFSLSQDDATNVASRMIENLRGLVEKHSGVATKYRSEIATAMTGTTIASFYRSDFDKIQMQEGKMFVLNSAIDLAVEQTENGGHAMLAALILSPHKAIATHISTVSEDQISSLLSFLVETIESTFYSAYMD